MKTKCSNCKHLGRDCPKLLLLLPLDDVIDWCLQIMTDYKITHEMLARLSNTPKGTIDRILAKQSADCRYSTVHAIVCALFEYLGLPVVCLNEVSAEPAVQAGDLRLQATELQQALAASEKDRQALQDRIADFIESRTLMKEQLAKKDEHIDRLSNTIQYWRRVVKTLAILLGLAVLTIITALVIDRLIPGLGFIWR